MIETWNDHEEGTAIEDGIPSCGPGTQEQPMTTPAAKSNTMQERP
jgi:hypothetical protein